MPASLVGHVPTGRSLLGPWPARGLPRPARSGYLIGALAALTLVAGCDDRRRAASPSTIEPLTTRAYAPAPGVALAPRALATQGDFDALEASQRDRRPIEELIAVYGALAEGATPDTRREDALLLQRHALLLAGGRGGRDGIARATRIGDELNRTAPNDPHTLYLNGWLKRLILQSGAGGRAMIVAEFNVMAAEQVLDDWGRLLALDATYDGPGDHDGPAIAADLAQLTAGLAAFRASAAGGDPALPAPRGRPATPRDLSDNEQLAAFEAMGLGQRRGLCRDRNDQQLVGGTSAAAARLDLACALLEADGRGGASPEPDPDGAVARALASGALPPDAAGRLPVAALDRALDAVGRLVPAASFDPCRVRADVLGRVAPDTPERAFIEAHLRELAVPTCP